MKKTTYLLAFTLISAASYAQSSKLDLLINQVNSYMAYRGPAESLNNYRKNYRGIQAGLSLQSGLTKKISLVTELYYASKGSVLKEGNILSAGRSSLRISTLELPVLARVYFGKIYFNAGPYASYLLSGRIKTDAHGSNPASSAPLSFAPGKFRRWETGLQAGAGYAFHIRSAVLSIDLRYGYGLTSLSSDIERYNRTYVVGVRLSRSSKK